MPVPGLPPSCSVVGQAHRSAQKGQRHSLDWVVTGRKQRLQRMAMDSDTPTRVQISSLPGYHSITLSYLPQGRPPNRELFEEYL